MALPEGLESAIDAAWQRARDIPGYIGEKEFRALGMLFVGAPRNGVTVEIGSFKGKSTVGLATLALRYGIGPVVSVDPHNAPSVTDPMLRGQSTSFEDFSSALRAAGVEHEVEAYRVTSQEAALGWSRSIRLLWIDGDHTYDGAKLDFDLFSPFLAEGAIVAIHDTLHEFEGPIRVFVERILRSDEFGAAGLLHTIGWGQYRPGDGIRFRRQRQKLARRASRLLPLVAGGRSVAGFSKTWWKLQCFLVPHRILTPAEWEVSLSAFDPV